MLSKIAKNPVSNYLNEWKNLVNAGSSNKAIKPVSLGKPFVSNFVAQSALVQSIAVNLVPTMPISGPRYSVYYMDVYSISHSYPKSKRNKKKPMNTFYKYRDRATAVIPNKERILYHPKDIKKFFTDLKQLKYGVKILLFPLISLRLSITEENSEEVKTRIITLMNEGARTPYTVEYIVRDLMQSEYIDWENKDMLSYKEFLNSGERDSKKADMHNLRVDNILFNAFNRYLKYKYESILAMFKLGHLIYLDDRGILSTS